MLSRGQVCILVAIAKPKNDTLGHTVHDDKGFYF